MKNLKKLGKVLSKNEQKEVNGGYPKLPPVHRCGNVGDVCDYGEGIGNCDIKGNCIL